MNQIFPWRGGKIWSLIKDPRLRGISKKLEIISPIRQPEGTVQVPLSYLPDLITLSPRQPFLTHGIRHLSIPSRTFSRYLDATVSSQFEKSFFPSPHILALQTSSFNFLTNSFDFFGGNYFRTWLKIHNPSSLWKSHFESCFLVFEFSRKKNRIASNDSKEKVVIYLILFEISDHPPSPFFPPSRPRRRLERRSLWLIGTHCTWESQV